MRDKISDQIDVNTYAGLMNQVLGLVLYHQPSYKDLDNLMQSFVDIASKNKVYEEISEDM